MLYPLSYGGPGSTGRGYRARRVAPGNVWPTTIVRTDRGGIRVQRLPFLSGARSGDDAGRRWNA